MTATTTRLAALAAPAVGPAPELGDELAELEAISRDLAARTLSDGTRRAYAKAWRSFESFCGAHGLEALPAHPESVRWYVAWMSVQHDADGLPRFSTATVRQHLAGVSERHLRDGYLDPTGHRGVGDLVRGLAKLRAERPVRKRPLPLDDVLRIIGAMEHGVWPGGISAARDAAAIWLGFVGALRRGEAAALRMRSLRLDPRNGIHVRVGKSKADQANELPDVVVLPFGAAPITCAPCAVHRWVALARASELAVPSERRRAFMALLYSFDLDAHSCGLDGPGLVTSADLASSAPLLRATYRNRRGGAIHDRGVTGDALHAMLLVRMGEAGMDPGGYGFHSLRAGHVTQARRNGATTEEVMRAGRWRRAETVDVYDREHDPAARNSVMRLGL